MKIKELKTKLWFNIFLRVTVIFIVFSLILALSNVAFLVEFFVKKEKSALADQIKTVAELDIENDNLVINTLSEINEKHNFDVEIYNSRGSILFTTHGGQMMDFFHQNNDRFKMSHEEMETVKSEDLGDGIIFKQVIRRFDGNEFLLCQKELTNGVFAEVRIQKQLITQSAKIANEFILIVTGVCLILSLFWIYYFARKFSQPISQMNLITKDMANLDFSRKINNKRVDEIGQLSNSINELSNSLSSALEDLKEKNRRLQDDIEAQRRLDSMRKAFIANVSHELKTPLAIINGYAEGLKLDINPKSRQEYCDTIISEGNRMNSLVLSIMELSKYESGQIPLNLTSFNIGEAAERILNRIFKGENITKLNLIPKDTLVFADEMQIELVLTAILENALVHTPEGGRVTVKAETNEKVRISILNTGSHIENEKMPQIWQSFYRGDTSHKRDSSHFGLGLSIVSAIIKMHNSNCGVYNTEDGVCFWFEIDRYIEA